MVLKTIKKGWKNKKKKKKKKLLVTQTNATLNSLIYKISAIYYNLTKETIFFLWRYMYMMNINVKSPNLHIKYLPNTKKIDPTLNSKFVCTVVYCSEFKVIFS